MEGLLIAEELQKIPLPSKRLPWRFLDAYTFILPLTEGALWMFNRPPNPRLAFQKETPEQSKTYSGFQDLLVAKASGDLLRVEQLKLDRVVTFHFAAAQGFVPSPPVKLIVELTGRNCNIILVDENNHIFGAARDIAEDTNRFRQIRIGLSYQFPPPYEKIDPRVATESDLQLALVDKTLSKARGILDGIGPELTKALVMTSGISAEKKLESSDFSKLIPSLQILVKTPTQIMQEALALPKLEDLRKQESREVMLNQLRLSLDKEIKLLQVRLEDIDKARLAAIGNGQRKA